MTAGPVTVPFYDTQKDIIDRVARQGTFGPTRESAIRGSLMAHVADRLSGAPAYVGGTATPDVLAAPFPEYGARRYERVLQPVTGAAVPVRRGEVLRIEQVVGGTCVDFNAFSLHDYKETLDCGFTRSFQSFNPGQGELIWTNAPRGRPMFAIMQIPLTCELDIVGHRCNRIFQELGWGLSEHVNCQDSLAEAIREYRLTPDDVHDSFNLWMATTIDDSGRRQFRWNPAQRGDRFEVLALFDVLAVAVICGVGDLVGINNFAFAPIRLEVFEASPATDALTDAVVARWGNMKSQVGSADLASTPVLAERVLSADPGYRPAYRPAPAGHEVEIELSPAERRLLAALMESGQYGTTEGEAVRAACMRWCNRHVTRVRRPQIDFLQEAEQS
jgi:uncharacterized protein YcgI (DUF1989 family)